ncbi:anti-sigma-D factor RsdA [Actinokineospora sp. NPDC004072]
MSDRGFDDGRDPFDDLHVLDDLEADGELIDFARVHADDAFLDALGASLRGDGPPADTDDLADAELALLLTSWRDDVDSEPIGELVDPRLAAHTVVHAARTRKQRRPRLLVPVAAAAAVFAIAITGAGLAARNAQPGDTLWGLTQVLYSDHARSVEAAAAVREDLAGAQTALAKGDLTEARTKLMEAGATLSSVADEEGREELAAQHADLESQLPGAPADGVLPPPSANPTTAAPTTTPQSSDPSTPSSTTAPTTQPTTTSPSSPPTTTTDQPTSTTSATSGEPKGDPGDAGNGSSGTGSAPAGSESTAP